VKLKGKRLAAVISVTAALALGSTAVAATALAAPAASQPSTKIPPQLSVKGLLACASKHQLGKATLQFILPSPLGLAIDDLAAGTLPLAAEIVFAAEAAEYGTKFFTFYYDCVTPYISPKAISLFNDEIILPWFSVNQPKPNPVPKPAAGISVSPSSGKLGDKFTISGQNWTAGGTLRITIPYGSKGWFAGGPWTFTVPAGGSWSVSATVSQQTTPGSTLTSPPGVYVFTATENQTQETASYTVLATSPTGNPSSGGNPTTPVNNQTTPPPGGGGPTFVCVTGPGGSCNS
jgi:hypothetical protein